MSYFTKTLQHVRQAETQPFRPHLPRCPHLVECREAELVDPAPVVDKLLHEDPHGHGRHQHREDAAQQQKPHRAAAPPSGGPPLAAPEQPRRLAVLLHHVLLHLLRIHRLVHRLRASGFSRVVPGSLPRVLVVVLRDGEVILHGLGAQHNSCRKRAGAIHRALLSLFQVVKCRQLHVALRVLPASSLVEAQVRADAAGQHDVGRDGLLPVAEELRERHDEERGEEGGQRLEQDAQRVQVQDHLAHVCGKSRGRGSARGRGNGALLRGKQRREGSWSRSMLQSRFCSILVSKLDDNLHRKSCRALDAFTGDAVCRDRFPVSHRSGGVGAFV
jgi:hypothetical protein